MFRQIDWIYCSFSVNGENTVVSGLAWSAVINFLSLQDELWTRAIVARCHRMQDFPARWPRIWWDHLFVVVCMNDWLSLPIYLSIYLSFSLSLSSLSPHAHTLSLSLSFSLSLFLSLYLPLLVSTSSSYAIKRFVSVNCQNVCEN